MNKKSVSRMYKRVLAMMLAFVMVVGMVPVTAFAEEKTAIATENMTISVSGTFETTTGGENDTDATGEEIKALIFDGVNTSFWTSTLDSVAVGNPYLKVDLGSVYTLDQIDYTPRWADGHAWECTGNIKKLVVEVSEDGETWTAVTPEGGFDLTEKIASDDAASFPAAVTFEAVNAQYVRLSATESHFWDGSNKGMTVAELAIYGEEYVEEEPTPEPAVLYAFDTTVLAANAKANSQQLPVAWTNDGGADWAFTDNDSWWHSRYQNFDQKAEWEVGSQKGDGKPEVNPIWIETGFDKVWYVESLTYLGRPNANGLIKDYTVSVANLADPAAEPTDADYTVVKTGTLDATTETQTITLDEVVAATHVRLTATSAYSGWVEGKDMGDGHVAAKKIEIFGYDRMPETEEPEVPVVDKAALEAKVAELADTDTTVYTEETAAAFAEALAAAQEVAAKEDATQEEVDAALAALEAAFAALEEKPEEPEEPEEPAEPVAFDLAVLAKNAKASSEQDPPGWTNDGYASWAFDTENHWWHTKYSNEGGNGATNSDEGLVSDSQTQWIQTGFDKVWYLDHITYVSRGEDMNCFNEYKVYVANMEDPTAEPAAEDFVLVKEGNLENLSTEQTIQLDEVAAATHVRIEVVSVHLGAGRAYVAAKQIQMYGYDQNPNGEPEVPVVVDKTALAAKVEEVKKLDVSAYPIEVVLAVLNALSEADAVIANADATQEEVDAALAALEAAVEGLEEEPEVPVVDKAALEAKVAELADTDTTVYTEETAAAFAEALAAANAVLANEEAAQEEVDAALAALEAAFAALEEKPEVPVADKAALEAKVAELADTDTTVYTEETAAAFAEALAAANAVLANEETTQEEVDEALAALEAAFAALEVKTEPTPEPEKTYIPVKGVTAGDEELVNSPQNEEGPANLAIDGNEYTIWHTDWYEGPSYDDHWIQLEFDSAYMVGGFEYLPRQTGNTNGMITSYKILVSEDGENWTEVAAGNWDSSDRSWQTVEFDAVKAKYVRLKSEGGESDIGIALTCAAEIRAIGAVVACEEHTTELRGAKEATCTEAGYTGDTVCTTCLAVVEKGESIEALGHAWGEAVVVEATCTADGSSTKTCAACGEEDVEVLKATGHDLGEYEVTKEATCEEAGEETASCAVCGEKVTKEIAALGHAWGEWTVVTEATYTEAGLEERVCATCGEKEEREIAVKANPFEDVEEDQYYFDPVMWAVENGITSGLNTTTFGTGNACTREQIVTFLWNYAGKPEATQTSCTFKDVDPSHYYYKAMLWANENKYVSGYNADEFGVGDPCTREQIVMILWKFAGEKAAESTECTFADANAEHYYYNAMLWAVENGVVAGYNDTTFGVGDACTREQIVTFLYRYNNLEK